MANNRYIVIIPSSYFDTVLVQTIRRSRSNRRIQTGLSMPGATDTLTEAHTAPLHWAHPQSPVANVSPVHGSPDHTAGHPLGPEAATGRLPAAGPTERGGARSGTRSSTPSLSQRRGVGPTRTLMLMRVPQRAFWGTYTATRAHWRINPCRGMNMDEPDAQHARLF